MEEQKLKVDGKAIEAHLALLFSKEPQGFVCLRGIGEKGTAREGVFREDIFLEPSRLGWADFVKSVVTHAHRRGERGVDESGVPRALAGDRGRAESCGTSRALSSG